jgi:hypothetical protein
MVISSLLLHAQHTVTNKSCGIKKNRGKVKIPHARFKAAKNEGETVLGC